MCIDQWYEHWSCSVKDRRPDLNGRYEYRYGIDNWDGEQRTVLQPGVWMGGINICYCKMQYVTDVLRGTSGLVGELLCTWK